VTRRHGRNIEVISKILFSAYSPRRDEQHRLLSYAKKHRKRCQLEKAFVRRGHMRTRVVLIFFPRRPLAGAALRAAGENAKTSFIRETCCLGTLCTNQTMCNSQSTGNQGRCGSTSLVDQVYAGGFCNCDACKKKVIASEMCHNFVRQSGDACSTDADCGGYAHSCHTLTGRCDCARMGGTLAFYSLQQHLLSMMSAKMYMQHVLSAQHARRTITVAMWRAPADISTPSRMSPRAVPSIRPPCPADVVASSAQPVRSTSFAIMYRTLLPLIFREFSETPSSACRNIGRSCTPYNGAIQCGSASFCITVDALTPCTNGPCTCQCKVGRHLPENLV